MTVRRERCYQMMLVHGVWCYSVETPIATRLILARDRFVPLELVTD